MKIFWSWQSDRDPKLHHYFVRDALKEACKLIASDPVYEEAERPEVDHDTKNVAGTPDITSTILAKIASANVFVADMTPVGKTDPAVLQPAAPEKRRAQTKFLQNPNVMSELGYAERALSPDRIILVANTAHYPGPEALPFDWRHRRGATTYSLDDGATKSQIVSERKRFAKVLKSCIQPILAAQTPAQSQPQEINWQKPSDSDRAVWSGALGELRFRNDSIGEMQRRVRLDEGPRIFARIAPSEWPAPPRSDLGSRISKLGLAIRSRDGDWGVNSDGALMVWGRINSDRDAMKVWNATQWFQKTGEIWAVNTNSFTEHNGRNWFSTDLPFKPLDEFVRKGVAAIQEMGGNGPIGTKLGVADIGDTVFPGNHGSQFVEALASNVTIEDVAEKWTPNGHRELLLRFWNQLRDAYGLPPMTMADFERVSGVPPLEE